MKHIVLISAILAAPAAQAFQAQNSMKVTALGQGTFEVAYRGGRAGVSDFWCAAGDYVVRELALSGTTQIYRTTVVPRRSGEDMAFSLSPEGATTTGLLTFFGLRKSVTAAHARHLCDIRVRRR